MAESSNRPVIVDYRDPVEFVKDMLRYRRQTEAGFSVAAVSRDLRRVSPTLVSLVVRRKRALTLDRAEEFARLLNLNASERFYFKNWVGRKEKQPERTLEPEGPARNKKEVATSILNDWINIYVKDFFQIPGVQKDPSLIAQHLMHFASPKRIEKSLHFLLREGHLRRTLEGRIVPEAKLAVADTRVPSKKIREVHKGALSLARSAIDVFPAHERMANMLLIPLDDKGYDELLSLIHEFAEKLKDFATEHAGTGDRLYQLIVNVSPIGGKNP